MTMKKVIDKINSFKDVEELRNYLVEHNYKGCIAEADNCPLTNMLKAESSQQAKNIEVGRLYIDFEMTEVYRFSLSNVAKQFVEAFDNGEFLELAMNKTLR